MSSKDGWKKLKKKISHKKNLAPYFELGETDKN